MLPIKNALMHTWRCHEVVLQVKAGESWSLSLCVATMMLGCYCGIYCGRMTSTLIISLEGHNMHRKWKLI